MLLGQAIELLRTKIESTNWVEKYGGLVQAVTYNSVDFEGASETKVMPISCTVNTDRCEDPDSFYNDLVPNDEKKSILYFETISPLSFAGDINGNRGFSLYTGRVRLVGWVNSKRLGLENDCFLSAKLIKSLLPVLNREIKGTDEIFEGSTIQFRVISEVEKSEAIFARYTYDLGRQYLLQPFDYFALDIDVQVSLKTGCEYIVPLANSACWLGDPEENGVPADYQGDLTGTFTGVQKFGDLSCEIVGSGAVSFVVKALDRDNETVILGTFEGDIGDSLTDAAKWTTSFDIFNYIGIGNTVGNGNIFSFAKLDFANDNTFLNLLSKEIFVEIRRGSPVTSQVGLESILYIPREDLEGLFTRPFCLWGTSDNRFLISEFGTESSSQSGLVEANFDQFYTKRNQRFNSTLRWMSYFFVDEGTDPPTIYGAALGEPSGGFGRQILEFPVIGFDANDRYILGVGLDTDIIPPGYPSSLIIHAPLNERKNGKPVIFNRQRYVSYWDGAAWQEVELDIGIIPGSTNGGDLKVFGNTVYFSHNTRGIYIITYSGDPTVPTNWNTALRINISNAAQPPSGGTGDIANTKLPNNMVLDTVNTVFGEPVMYVSITVSHVIMRIQANKLNPSADADWDFDIILGQVDVIGNDNLQGTAATLTNPLGMWYKDGFIYFVQGALAHNIRRFNAIPSSPDYLLVEDYLGEYSVQGLIDFIEF